MTRFRLAPDPFILLLVAAAGSGALLPVRGLAAEWLAVISDVAIGLVFFLHGARLRREVVIAGIRRWRLHALILLITFVAVPILGFAAAAILSGVLPAALLPGVVFLAFLPSTVQSSVTLTAVAGGNVVAAVCAAAASNLIGIAVTPLALAVLLSDGGSGLNLGGLGPILFQLLLPFLLGQALHPLLGGFLQVRRKLFSLFDRGAILLVVYLAFSAAVIGGSLNEVSIASFVIVVAACAGLFGVAMAVALLAARFFGFSREDEIAILFCGSQKSLVAGVPMANVLFAGPELGAVLLPVVLFHQIQLIVSAVVARRYARPVTPAMVR